ncbi:hypothetical protein [Phenylobacterium sp. SCN 70-31]|uniref:hypothetical protein n=1 Tax=Phenylobacterium sp. SCN 70-31 TaxID=1660129 RepID=UPI00086AED90|nr:hypothetical protein [Phenylobacterium sp. SCN 70-31]ODT85696.1 MAG: hypothetical protein ABS78_19195 [Phenylobacterium sp. SCN 70-31]
MKPFTPADDATASIAATTLTANAAIKQQPTGAHQIRLYNAGASTVFWALGPSGVTAALTDIPLPAGAIEVITLANGVANPATHVAAITASGSATLYVSTGLGL